MTKNIEKSIPYFLKQFSKMIQHLYRMQKKNIGVFFCSLSYFLELIFRLAVREMQVKSIMETTQNFRKIAVGKKVSSDMR